MPIMCLGSRAGLEILVVEKYPMCTVFGTTRLSHMFVLCAMGL